MASKSKKGPQRKLTANLCSDVLGYSRAMGENEAATVRTPKPFREMAVFLLKRLASRETLFAPRKPLSLERGKK